MFLGFAFLGFRCLKKNRFFCILCPPYCINGANIRFGREMFCLPYAVFLPSVRDGQTNPLDLEILLNCDFGLLNMVLQILVIIPRKTPKKHTKIMSPSKASVCDIFDNKAIF